MNGKYLLALIWLPLAALVLLGCDDSSSSKDKSNVPGGLAGDCNSVTDGGTLTVDAVAVAGAAEPGVCTTYSFAAVAGENYNIVLIPESSDPNLLMSEQSNFSSAGTSVNGEGEMDIIQILADFTATIYVAVTLPTVVAASTFQVGVVNNNPGTSSGTTVAVPAGVAFDPVFDLDGCTTAWDAGSLAIGSTYQMGFVDNSACVLYDFPVVNGTVYTVSRFGQRDFADEVDFLVSPDATFTPITFSPAGSGSLTTLLFTADATQDNFMSVLPTPNLLGTSGTGGVYGIKVTSP